MTSNLGSEYILNKAPNLKELLDQELNRTFKPEFLNRIDEIITFNSLNKDTVYKILDNIIANIEDRLKENNLHIVLTDNAKKHIVDSSYNESFGARPIKRYVTKNIESLIAKNIIEGNIKFGETITIDVNKDNYIIKEN